MVEKRQIQREIIKTPDEAIVQWQSDSKFDSTELDVASLNIPLLHGRYLRYLSDARLRVKRYQAKRKQLYQTLRSYYMGNLNDPESLKTLNRPVMAVRHLRQDVNDVIEADHEWIAFEAKAILVEETVAVLEEILKAINLRGFQIKNALEWRKLTNFSPV